MNIERGDVVLVSYPFASGTGTSRRPVLVVQSDRYNHRIQNTVVAQITTNLSHAGDPAHLPIDLHTPAGQQSGLLHDSVVSCINLATVRSDRVDRVIGHLPGAAMQRVDECLRAALNV